MGQLSPASGTVVSRRPPPPATGVPSLGRALGLSRPSPTSLRWALGPLLSLLLGGSRWGGDLVPKPVSLLHPACSLPWVSLGWLLPWSPGGMRLECWGTFLC